MPNYLAGLSEYTEVELIAELLKRGNTQDYTVQNHSEYGITIDENWKGEKDGCEGVGRAVILIIQS